MKCAEIEGETKRKDGRDQPAGNPRILRWGKWKRGRMELARSEK